ncbi:MAG: hypothetical protein MUE40_03445 [Anaerolineae bacterium]|nr:hypothetical protein [Anaerolineae bacterium]
MTHSPRRLRRWLTPLTVLCLLMLALLLRFDRPLIRGDGVAYLAWADTLLIDHDIDLTNQVEKLRFVNDESKVMYDVSQQKWVNVFPFGVAILQAPFYLTGHVFAQQGWLNVNPAYFEQHQGVGLPYSLWVMFGANLLALAAVIFAFGLAQRVTDAMTAALVAFVVFAGTPLFYYSTVSPFHSHNAGAFTLAAFLLLLGRVSLDGTTPRPRCWILLGVLAGLTVLIRWQLLLVFVPAWLLLLYERRWRGALLAAAVAALVLLPLPLVWYGMYGQFLLVPFDAARDTTFIISPLVGMGNVVAHLLHHSPVLWLCLPGVPALWRLNRRWTLLLVTMIALQVVINGAALDWWAGESYGMRRMSELYAVYVLLIAAGCGALIAWLRRRVGGLAPRLVRGLLLLCLVYIGLYVLAFFYWTWTHPSRLFHAEPEVMIAYFLDPAVSGRDAVFRWQIMESLFQTHLGPPAWPQPGP